MALAIGTSGVMATPPALSTTELSGPSMPRVYHGALLLFVIWILEAADVSLAFN